MKKTIERLNRLTGDNAAAGKPGVTEGRMPPNAAKLHRMMAEIHEELEAMMATIDGTATEKHELSMKASLAALVKMRRGSDWRKFESAAAEVFDMKD